MKKFLLLVAVVVSAITANAQRSIDLQTTLDSPATNAVIRSNQAISMKVTIKNLGPDSLRSTDTLTFWQLANNTAITGLNFFIPSLLKDSSVTITFNTNGLQGGPQGLSTLDLCALVILNYKSGNADSVRDNSSTGNNRSCISVQYTNAAAIGDIAESRFTSKVYPNPVSNEGTISYTLPVSGKVTVKVMDLTGRVIAVPFEGFQDGGEQTVKFNAAELANGVYLYEINLDGFVSTDKFIVTK
jgi:hypothetical protein